MLGQIILKLATRGEGLGRFAKFGVQFDF